MIQLGDLQVIERKEWNAAAPKPGIKTHIPKRLVIHHSWSPRATDYMKKPEDKRGTVVKAIQNYHQNTQGWKDIGYHFLIGPDGKVFEGVDPLILGTHCGGEPAVGAKRVFGNTGSVGICMLGDYDAEKPTAAALAALNKLISHLCTRFGISEVAGHFQAWTRPPKTCPGKEMVQVLGVVFPAMKAAWNKAYLKNALT